MCSECVALQREPRGIPLHEALRPIIDHPARAPDGRHAAQMTAYRCDSCGTVWARELRSGESNQAPNQGESTRVSWHLMSRRLI